MDDIVEQLRKSANTIYSQDGYTFRLGLHYEAADEIERLREALRLMPKTITDAANEIERLREVRDMLQAINEAKDKEIAILRAEKHLAALKEGE